MNQPGRRRKAPGKKQVLHKAFRLTGSMIVFLVTVGLVLLALLAIVYRDQLNLDAVKRWITYGTISRDDDGMADEFVFSGNSQSGFATLDGGLLVCSTTTLQLYSSSGTQELSVAVSMENPVVDVSGEYALIYDAGGSEAYVLHGANQIFSYETDSGYDLISGHINEKGYFTIVEQTSGYKATVTVYNSSAEKQISWNESTNFIMDAAVSPDNRILAMIKISQDDTAFHSELVYYDAASAAELSSTSLEDELVIDMLWKDDLLWLQLENGIAIVDSDGEVEGSWSDDLRYLVSYALEGSDFALEYLSKYRSGGTGELMIIDDEGNVSVSRTIDEEILSISVAGNYIAVLTPGYLTIYKDELEEYASVSTATARKAIMREDGSVMLIDTESAKLFVP